MFPENPENLKKEFLPAKETQVTCLILLFKARLKHERHESFKLKSQPSGAGIIARFTPGLSMWNGIVDQILV